MVLFRAIGHQFTAATGAETSHDGGKGGVKSNSTSFIPTIGDLMPASCVKFPMTKIGSEKSGNEIPGS